MSGSESPEEAEAGARRLVSEGMRGILLARRKAGVRLGRPRSLSAAIVARIVDEHEAGASQSAIARRLNADGVPTARGAARWYQATVRAVLRSRGGSRPERPSPPTPAVPAAARPVAMPPAMGFPVGFIGRTRELAEVGGLLATEGVLTLTGPAGVGKTRLALELVRRIAPHPADGIAWIPLAPVSRSELVARAVASRMSLWEQPGRSAVDTVVGRLRNQRLLLVLDNCEHVLEGCVELVERLRANCPGVSLMMTTQIPLGVPGERVWPVPSLSLPPGGTPAGDAESDSVKLFADRAVIARRGLRLGPETAGAVAEICRRLDGIPLAIELAAARVAVLAPGEIAARLDDRFALLVGGDGAALERHQTLRGALDWSHDLLPPWEQQVLRRLSVFVGGCPLEGAEMVCGRATGPGLLDALTALVSKSLLLADTSGARARYRLLQTIQAHAAEKLARAGEVQDGRDRHLRWVVDLVERAESSLIGPEQQECLDALEADHDNIRAALGWAVETGQAEAALRLVGSLTLFWRMRGHFREARRWSDAALAGGRDEPPRIQAPALLSSGFFAHMLDDDIAARPALEEASIMSAAAGDERSHARALLLLVNIELFEHPVAATVRLDACGEVARRVGDTWCLAHALALSGLAHIQLGDRGRAAELLRESLSIARAAEDQHSMCIGLNLLGDLIRQNGDQPGAEIVLQEGLEVARRVGEPYAESRALTGLGEIALACGNHDRAEALMSEALALDREVTPALQARDLCLLSEVVLARGDPPTARTHVEEALTLEPGGPAGRPYLAIRRLAEITATEGDPERAEHLAEEALGLARTVGDGRVVASTLHLLGNIARLRDDLVRAQSLHQESLRLGHELGDATGVTDSLEAVGALSGRCARPERAARLLGAAESLRRANGYLAVHRRCLHHDEDVTAARAALGEARFDEIHAEGGAWSIDQAVAYAQRGRGARGRPSTGGASLTPTEREVVALAAEGLTNLQIGARLFISPRTVARHLYNVFAKLGITSRTELALQATRRDLAPEGRAVNPKK